MRKAPFAGSSLVEAAVVEAIGGFAPELDPLGHDSDRAPVLRALDRLLGHLRPHAIKAFAQRLVRLDRLALPRDDRLQLVIARPAREQLLGQRPLGDLSPAL